LFQSRITNRFTDVTVVTTSQVAILLVTQLVEERSRP
jgi:hypothetical protein